MNDLGFRPHSSHWGVFSARWQDGALDVLPYPGDPDPNGVIDNFPAALRHRPPHPPPPGPPGGGGGGAGPASRAR